MPLSREQRNKLLLRAVTACRAIYKRTHYDVAERACWYRWLQWLARQNKE